MHEATATKNHRAHISSPSGDSDDCDNALSGFRLREKLKPEEVARPLPGHEVGITITSIETQRRNRPTSGTRLASPQSGEDAERSVDIEDIFRHYVDPVYRFIHRQVGNQHDAEDLTSEVFLSASKSLDVTRAENAIGRWLFTVSRTVIADHWRRHYRVPPLVDIDDLQIAEFTPGSRSEAKMEKKSRLVSRLLDGLPERYRQVLELRFLHGYSLVETSQELGISVDNVKITQHRALAKAVQISGDLL